MSPFLERRKVLIYLIAYSMFIFMLCSYMETLRGYVAAVCLKQIKIDV